MATSAETLERTQIFQAGYFSMCRNSKLLVRRIYRAQLINSQSGVYRNKGGKQDPADQVFNLGGTCVPCISLSLGLCLL